MIVYIFAELKQILNLHKMEKMIKPELKAKIIRIEKDTLDKVAAEARKEHRSSHGFIITAIEEKLSRLKIREEIKTE